MHLTAIEFVSNDSGWVTASRANSGGLFETEDAGQSWDTVLIREVERFDALELIGGSTGYAAGDAPYKTTDGWQTWAMTAQIIRLPSPVYRRVRFVTPEIGWMVGSYGLILRTTY